MNNCYVFWKRLLAFFVDSLILGFFGGFLGSLFAEQFYGFGYWGRLIGFTIWVLYFGLFNSEIFKGQTLGKKLLKIKVVNQKGEYLSPNRSFLRAVIFFIPGIFNGIEFPLYLINSFAFYLSSVIFAMVGGCIAYLFLFNLPTRQSLHDLAVHSYVINSNCEQTDFNENQTKNLHYIIMGVIAIIAVTAPLVIYKIFASPINTVEDFSKIIKHDLDVDVIGANVNYRFSLDKGGISSLNILVRNRDLQNNYKNKILILYIVKTAMEKYPKSKKFNEISVTLTKNYDIWIASKQPYFRVIYPPNEWMKYLKGKR